MSRRCSTWLTFGASQSRRLHNTTRRGVHGALVQRAVPGGPAARAGVVGFAMDASGRVLIGDLIVKIDGADVSKSDDVYRILEQKKVGDTVTIELVNGGRSRTVQVTLEASS